MRRRVTKKDVSPQGGKNGFILVLAGYGYQIRMSGSAPGWGPKSDATIFDSKEKAEKAIAEINRHRVFPTIEKI